MRPNEHLLRAFGQGQVVKRPGKGLFLDMRVMQKAIAQPISRRVQNLPPVNIVIPAGVGMQDRDRNSPPASGLVELHAEDFGLIRCNGAGDKGKDKAQTSHTHRLAQSRAKNTHVCVFSSGRSGWSSTARDCEANSRRSSIRHVITVAPISASGPKSQAAAESAK